MPGPSTITAVFCSRRRAAFTLVEMLVVMGIIVVLLAASLPALRGLSQSESRRGAVGNMMGVLDHARMMAISDGLATYVVFASTDQALNADLRGRSCAIYQDGDNITFTPQQKSPWMSLPKGMAFKVTETVTPSGDATATVARSILTCYQSVQPDTADPAFPLSRAAGVGNKQLPYLKFDSTGIATVPVAIKSPLKTEDYLKVLIFPGSIDAQGNEVPTQNVGGAGNKQASQLEEIALKPATGRAQYIIDPTNNLSTPSSTTSPSP